MPDCLLKRLLLIACCASLLSARTLSGLDAAPAPDWQKLAGKPEAVPANPAFATPGQYLHLADRLLAFPAGGLAIDLPLDATLVSGHSVKAALQPNRSLWVDLDGDGKAENAERFNPTQSGYGPVTVMLKYKNDTQAPYTFYLVSTPTPGTYRLVTGQMIRYSFNWKHHPATVLLFDQNNNGRYDDVGQDVLIIDNRPGSFLAKTITLGSAADAVAEIVLYPDGTRMELREYTGPTGVLDLISGYKPPQNGITVCHVAVESDLARPGFSQNCPRVRVPVGSYQFQTAALQRAREQVRVEKGGLAATRVEKDQTATVAWGGPVELKYGFRRNGENLVFDGLQLIAKEHQERYLPQPPQTIPLLYRAEEFLPATYPYSSAVTVPLGNGTVELDPAADPRDATYKPVLIKHKGRHMLLMLSLNYASGILGVVEVHDKLEFTPQDEKK